MKGKGYIKLISPADTSHYRKLELNILPGEKTPWHYHTLFSETFEILKGTLEVGKGKGIYHLKQGESATIAPNEKHYYHNVSNDECVIYATLRPGNKNFEKALLILKGLSNDGLSGASGIPKKLPDLALFIYLNNSRMVWPQKIAEPFFYYLAIRAIRKGRLRALELKYCGQ